MLIRFVLSAKGMFHHGGCAIVLVLVLRYNQGANVRQVNKDSNNKMFPG